MEGKIGSEGVNKHAAALHKKTIAAITSERNSFNPISLSNIGKDEEEVAREKINEIQESLGPEITESGSKLTSSDHYVDIGKYFESAKKTVNYGYTEDIETCGDFAFKTGHLKEAIESYDFAVTFGSKTAKDKLFKVVKYIFDKPEHICDSRHNSSGCCLRSKALEALKSVEGEAKKEIQKYLFEIGELNERKKRYHCAISSYGFASERGSLEASRKLAELGKTLKPEYPYLALIASKFANAKLKK